MENRSILKEKRNNILWSIWLVLTILSCVLLEIEYKNEKWDSVIITGALGFQFLAVFYRLLTFCFNFILAKIVKKRFKLNRLKGRVSPIYEVEDFTDFIRIKKYDIEYTELDLQWSVPFSVLFLEQEYICKGGYYATKPLIRTKELSQLWEEENKKELEKKLKKENKEQKRQKEINELNKQFNENYK